MQRPKAGFCWLDYGSTLAGFKSGPTLDDYPDMLNTIMRG